MLSSAIVAQLSPMGSQWYGIKIVTKGSRMITIIEQDTHLEAIASHTLKTFQAGKGFLCGGSSLPRGDSLNPNSTTLNK